MGLFKRVPHGSARDDLLRYCEIKRLAGMGFTHAVDEFDADTIEGLMLVDTFLAEAREANDK